MAEWISVKDRLPKRSDKPVLMICDEGYGLAKYTPETGNWHIQPFIDAWYRSKDCVTHWMPLPEPPRQEQMTVVVDIHVNGERIDVDSFTEKVTEVMRKALEPEKEKWEERQQALRRLKEDQY